MKTKCRRIAVALLVVCLVSAPFASAQYTDSITVLGGLGAISRDALEEMLAAIACPCDGNSCTCGAGGGPGGACDCDCLCACEKCAFLRAHPQGSVYITMTPGNPGTTYGGSWSEWGQGRMPVGAAGGGVNPTFVDYDGVTKTFAAGETGGEYRHTLGLTEMPVHSHTYTWNPPYAFAASPSATGFTAIGSGYSQGGVTTLTDWPNTQIVINNAGGSGGVTQSHNNVQPYVTCYMWERTDPNPEPFVCPDKPCDYCCSCGGGTGGTGDCGCDLSDYVTTTDLSTALGDYVNNASLATTLASYVTAADLSTALGSYYTKAEIDAKGYLTNVTSADPGNPITATKTGSVVDLAFGTLAVSKGGTGVTSFTGDSVLMSNAAGDALAYRAVTNQTTNPYTAGTDTAPSTYLTGSTNLVTLNTLRQTTYGMWVPDYDRPQSMTTTTTPTGPSTINNKTSWTVPRTGFVVIKLISGSGQEEFYYYIGTREVMHHRNNVPTASGNVQVDKLLPVTQGDIVTGGTYNASTRSAVFYPAKWAAF